MTEDALPRETFKDTGCCLWFLQCLAYTLCSQLNILISGNLRHSVLGNKEGALIFEHLYGVRVLWVLLLQLLNPQW